MELGLFYATTTPAQRRLLGDIDRAVNDLDQAFAALTDSSFECLSRPYKNLADAVLAIYRECNLSRPRP